jgi:hypothetical protein
MHFRTLPTPIRVIRLAILAGPVLVTLALAPRVAALPAPGGEADATANWETVSIPSLLVTDPVLAQQIALVPLGGFNNVIASGTANVPESLGGPIVRGFTELSGAGPNQQGGGTLGATSHARLVTWYQANGTGPIDIDVDVHIDGELAGGNYFTDALGNVTSAVSFAAILHTDTASILLFDADALLDVAATQAFTVLTASGDWSPSDFSSPSGVDGFLNQFRTVDLDDANENVVILDPGDRFAIELILDTALFAVGAFEAAARAGFDSTGGIAVRTDAPGASLVQVVVPEPTSLLLSVTGLLALVGVRRRRSGPPARRS